MFQLSIPSADHINTLLDQIAVDLAHTPALETFRHRWQTAYSRFGTDPAGELAYRDAWLYFQETVQPSVRRLPVARPAKQAAAEIEAIFKSTTPPRRLNRQLLARMRQARQNKSDQQADTTDLSPPHFDRPVFIVSTPRAGSTLLFETLAKFPAVWTIGMESHDIEIDLPTLHPATQDYQANRLTAPDATPTIVSAVHHWFSHRLQNRAGKLYHHLPAADRPASIRFVEKTPKNALRIPFLKAVFPTARFIYLYREPRANISSMLAGWRSRRFIAYRDLPGWPYQEWSFLLVPGWQTMIDRPLVEITAYQWRVTNETIQADLATLPTTDWCRITYQELTQQPVATIKRLSHIVDFKADDQQEQSLKDGLPVSHMALSPPAPDKWRQHEAELAMVISIGLT